MSCAGVITWNDFGGVAAGVRPGKAGRSKKPVVAAGKSVAAAPVAARRQEARISGKPVTGGELSRTAPLAGFEERRLEVDWAIVVRRCLDGDSTAWAELVRAQHRRVYGLCYRVYGLVSRRGRPDPGGLSESLWKPGQLRPYPRQFSDLADYAYAQSAGRSFPPRTSAARHGLARCRMGRFK